MEPSPNLGLANLDQAIHQLAESVHRSLGDNPDFAIVGIARGGVVLAQRLGKYLGELTGKTIPVGTVDPVFHRDDTHSNPLHEVQDAGNLPFTVDDANILLVDDVLFSGRTVKAALNELFDQGRPASVKLAALVDRGHRALPIQADFVGMNLPTEKDKKVKVHLSSDPSHPDSLEIL